ncbi:hypothetical protein LTR08_004345 [Meristemomyces frigidus]|nr:hypothetical protein LTR08_004345 [Meristemomyces frigidus]
MSEKNVPEDDIANVPEESRADENVASEEIVTDDLGFRMRPEGSRRVRLPAEDNVAGDATTGWNEAERTTAEKEGNWRDETEKIKAGPGNWDSIPVDTTPMEKAKPSEYWTTVEQGNWDSIPVDTTPMEKAKPSEYWTTVEQGDEEQATVSEPVEDAEESDRDAENVDEGSKKDGADVENSDEEREESASEPKTDAENTDEGPEGDGGDVEEGDEDGEDFVVRRRCGNCGWDGSDIPCTPQKAEPSTPPPLSRWEGLSTSPHPEKEVPYTTEVRLTPLENCRRCDSIQSAWENTTATSLSARTGLEDKLVYRVGSSKGAAKCVLPTTLQHNLLWAGHELAQKTLWDALHSHWPKLCLAFMGGFHEVNFGWGDINAAGWTAGGGRLANGRCLGPRNMVIEAASSVGGLRNDACHVKVLSAEELDERLARGQKLAVMLLDEPRARSFRRLRDDVAEVAVSLHVQIEDFASVHNEDNALQRIPFSGPWPYHCQRTLHRLAKFHHNNPDSDSLRSTGFSTAIEVAHDAWRKLFTSPGQLRRPEDGDRMDFPIGYEYWP